MQQYSLVYLFRYYDRIDFKFCSAILRKIRSTTEKINPAAAGEKEIQLSGHDANGRNGSKNYRNGLWLNQGRRDDRSFATPELEVKSDYNEAFLFWLQTIFQPNLHLDAIQLHWGFGSFLAQTASLLGAHVTWAFCSTGVRIHQNVQLPTQHQITTYGTFFFIGYYHVHSYPGMLCLNCLIKSQHPNSPGPRENSEDPFRDLLDSLYDWSRNSAKSIDL